MVALIKVTVFWDVMSLVWTILNSVIEKHAASIFRVEAHSSLIQFIVPLFCFISPPNLRWPLNQLPSVLFLFSHPHCPWNRSFRGTAFLLCGFPLLPSVHTTFPNLSILEQKALFSFIQYRSHRKWHVQQFFHFCVSICCLATGLLPSNDRGKVGTGSKAISGKGS
jgi:hypothetical protein